VAYWWLVEKVLEVTGTSFEFELTGGCLCLDFANTVDRRPVPEERQDHLNFYSDLLQWALQTKVLVKAAAASLHTRATADPRAVHQTMRRAVRLREAIFGIFSALADRRAPDHDDLGTMNGELKVAMSRSRIDGDHRGFKLWWDTGESDLSSPLWLVVNSAADLLLDDRWHLVRRCAASDCDWLFIDNSSNQRRRWCDMKRCGNRAKARRHYQATLTRKPRTQSARRKREPAR